VNREKTPSETRGKLKGGLVPFCRCIPSVARAFPQERYASKGP